MSGGVHEDEEEVGVGPTPGTRAQALVECSEREDGLEEPAS